LSSSGSGSRATTPGAEAAEAAGRVAEQLLEILRRDVPAVAGRPAGIAEVAIVARRLALVLRGVDLAAVEARTLLLVAEDVVGGVASRNFCAACGFSGSG